MQVENNKRKTLVQIIFLCNDIDNLGRTLLLLKQNSLFLNSKDYIILDISMLVSDKLIDWNNSIIKKDFFEDKFNQFKKYADWANEVYFNIDDESYGSLDRGISNIYKYNVNDVIWLDVDIIFNQYTLSTFLRSSELINKSKTRYAITPSLVKLWDNTWDVLVNDNFLNKPFKYNETNDSIKDTHENYGELSLIPLQNFKFAGGWFTLFSKNLLDFLEIPKTIKGFSPIDTWIMTSCNRVPRAVQYKINNLVVCEDRKMTDRKLYDKYIKFTGKNLDFYYSSYQELQKHFYDVLVKKCQLDH